MYYLVLSRQYIRVLKRVSRHKDFDRYKLNLVVNTLLSGKPLDLRHHDHQLSGPRADHRECHIQFDVLLEYKIERQFLVLTLVNLGSHSDLFE